MSETLATFTLVAAMILVFRALDDDRHPAIRGGAAGLLLGASVLVRQIALFFPVLLLPAVVLASRRPRPARAVIALSMAVGFLVPVGTWIARNNRASGVATVGTVDAESLLFYKAAGALAEDEHVSLKAAQEALGELLAPIGDDNYAQWAQRKKELATDTLRAHPAGAVISTGKGLAKVVLGPGGEGANVLLHLGPRWHWPRTAVMVLPLVVLLLGAGYGALTGDRRTVALLLVTIVYFTLAASGPESNARFRVPVVPFLAILAGMGWDRRRRRRDGREAPDDQSGGGSGLVLASTKAMRSWARPSRRGRSLGPKRGPTASTTAAMASMATWASSSRGGSGLR
jgi:hypothetical protein